MKFITAGFSALFSTLLKGGIWAYRLFISPLVGPNCRFSPSCSTYALEAIKIHGPWKGGYLSLRRILRCHPWGGSGYDPVSPKDGQ